MKTSRPWRKSSRSQGNGGNCVQARYVESETAEVEFQVGDSKLGEESPVFDLARVDFEGLLRAAR